MYIWTALYIEDNLEELRDQAIRIGEELGVKCPLTFLPLHISLKKSFPIDDKRVDECVDLLCDYFSHLGPFHVETDGLELNQGIIWLRVKENERLMSIHSYLVDMARDRFESEPHELDGVFKYHATVFTDTEEKLRTAFEKMRDFPLPHSILARDFLIGTSETGLPGEYSVLKHSHLGPSVSVKEQWEQFENS